jgi:hypothetical protein
MNLLRSPFSSSSSGLNLNMSRCCLSTVWYANLDQEYILYSLEYKTEVSQSNTWGNNRNKVEGGVTKKSKCREHLTLFWNCDHTVVWLFFSDQEPVVNRIERPLINTCTCMCVCVHMCVCICVCIHICICMCINCLVIHSFIQDICAIASIGITTVTKTGLSLSSLSSLPSSTSRWVVSGEWSLGFAGTFSCQLN